MCVRAGACAANNKLVLGMRKWWTRGKFLYTLLMIKPERWCVCYSGKTGVRGVCGACAGGPGRGPGCVCAADAGGAEGVPKSEASLQETALMV